jgi:hypothetical protein
VNSLTNEAAAGEVISLYATGAGLTNPSEVDGKIIGVDVLPVPRLPVSVRIGGVDAEVLYAGAAPLLVSGVLQVNVRVPAYSTTASTGLTYRTTLAPVVLTVGTTQSMAGVYLPVRPGPPANLKITFSPNPVAMSAAEPGKWFFTVTVSETAGVGVTLSSLQVDALDQSALLSVFDSTRVPAGGSVSGVFVRTCVSAVGVGVPTECFGVNSTWTLTGHDDNANSGSWGGSVLYQ